MKLSFLVALPLLLAACTSSNAASPSQDAAAADDASSDGPIDAADAADAYAQAVLAAHWMQLKNGPTVASGEKQDDIYFPSPQHGFAVSGPASAIYETTDRGDSWNRIYTHAGTYFRSVLFVDDNHGFASNLGAGIPGTGITDTNVLYETNDGGGSWNPVAPSRISGPMPSGICNETKIDGQHLVAVGRIEGPAFFMSSSDSGATWTSIDLHTQLAMLIDAHFTSPTDGIVVGGGVANPMTCTILHTSDGVSFQPVFSSKVGGSLCWKISFPSDQVGYVSVQDTAIGPASFLKTTDGGMHWTETDLPKGSGLSGIGVGFLTEDIGWISAEEVGSPVYRTSNGGQSWQMDTSILAPINRFRFVTPETAFAIGGAVWRLDVAYEGGG